MAKLIPPRRDESLTQDGVPTLRFSEYLEGLARDVNNVVIESSESSLLVVEVSNQNALIFRLSSRIDDLEAADDTDILNSRIANINSQVTRLIEELLIAVKASAPDLEQESEKVLLLQHLLHETKLLNARIEEAFETKLDGDDV